MKYRHKLLTDGGPSEEPEKRLPNVFHFFGEREIDGENYVGLIQEGQIDPSPTWWGRATFDETFEQIIDAA